MAEAARGADASAAAPPLAELRDIVKTFPGVRANDGITFTIEAGEVHGLLGENGAGKSTLMSILYGLYQPDEGSIRRDGAVRVFTSPRDALAAGVAIVQQHFALVPTLTVAENVVLGDEPGAFLRRGAIASRVRALSDRYHLDIDPEAVVGTLSIGQRQRVEILKCLYRDPQVIVFDEPTTVLTPQEIRDLFGIIRSLAAERRGIVLITHKLDELLDVTDRVTVLRHGRSAGTLTTASTDGPTLARLMVGRDVRLRSTATFVGLTGDDPALPHAGTGAGADVGTHTASRADASTRHGRAARVDAGGADAGPAALELRAVTRTVDGVHRLDRVSLAVQRGEVLGIAGVEGNGQRELVEVLCGTASATSGSLHVAGTDRTADGPLGLAAAGVRVVTEDRHGTGCVLDMTVAENLLCDRIGEAPYSHRGVISRGATDAAARRLIDEFRIKTPSPAVQIRALSGGNQQRAILARELSRDVTVLVAAQPTRGLDVGAIEEVTERITAARDAGAGVLLVSSDLTEIMALADRIAVLYRGRVIGVVDRDDARTERIGELMAGIEGAVEAGVP